MWTIWYENGEVGGSTFSEWQSCPDSGIVAVYKLIAADEFGNLGHICMGSDWYWMTPDGEIGESLSTADDQGVWLDFQPPAGAHVKAGSWVSNERMQEVTTILNYLIES